MKNLTYFLALGCILITHFSFAQLKETIIPEKAINSAIAMTHYVDEPDSHPYKWAKFEDDGKMFYKAYFNEETKKIVIVYSEEGKAQERWELQEKIPSIIENFLKLEFGKYKALNYRKVIQDDGEDYYAVDVDTKYRGYQRVKFHTSGKPFNDGLSQFVVNN
ncbi:MAG: hypothetical protein RIA69_02480 [Cyclobacteriaceae bacterium]